MNTRLRATIPRMIDCDPIESVQKRAAFAGRIRGRTRG
jgi:hypothetical protein